MSVYTVGPVACGTAAMQSAPSDTASCMQTCVQARATPIWRKAEACTPPWQGFVQFRMSGATHLDVEALNRRLKSNGALRMRHAMRPDEQYGEPSVLCLAYSPSSSACSYIYRNVIEDDIRNLTLLGVHHWQQ